jgi:pyruvate-formate lyase-activating enzyme
MFSYPTYENIWIPDLQHTAVFVFLAGCRRVCSGSQSPTGTQMNSSHLELTTTGIYKRKKGKNQTIRGSIASCWLGYDIIMQTTEFAAR